MAVEARIVANFPLRANTPQQIRWEGVLEWVDKDHPNPSGYPSRVLKVQCGLRDGQNGPFLSMPYVRKVEDGRMVAVKGKTGKYINYVDLGDFFQKSGTAAVLAYLKEQHEQVSSVPPPAPTQQTDLREAAQQAFRESDGAEGLSPVGASKADADDPFGDLPW